MLKKNLREHLNTTFSDQELDCWFDPLQLDLNGSERLVSVVFPHAFFAAWFQENMRHKFEEALSACLGGGYLVRYQGGNTAQTVGNTADAPAQACTPVDFPFGNAYVLDSYLANAKNEFAVSSLRELCQQERVIFNPFVLCGEPGSGKTHLLRAMGNHLARRGNGRRIYLGTVEDLDGVYSRRFARDPHGARTFLLEHDAVLVDDAQRLTQQPELQREVEVLFNDLHQSGKQMAFAFTGQLTELDGLQPSLLSRLKWGLLATLKAPDLDIRVRYIREQAARKRLRLPPNQQLSLAQHVKDLRLIQGLLIKLAAYKELMDTELTEEDFRKILEQSVGEHGPLPTPEVILQVVADHFEVSLQDIFDTGRRKQVVAARQVAMYLCRVLTRTSYPALGRIFGGRDHSTVLYAVKKIQKKQRVDPTMQTLLMDVEAKVRKQAAQAAG